MPASPSGGRSPANMGSEPSSDRPIETSSILPFESSRPGSRPGWFWKWEFSPKLCHGNLHPNNVIVDSQGVIHLIDWETATGNKNPQSELAEIYTWKTGKENVALFLEGYGLNQANIEIIMRDIQTLVLLRLTDVIRRKIIKNTTDSWKQDTYIQETATQLAIFLYPDAFGCPSLAK